LSFSSHPQFRVAEQEFSSATPAAPFAFCRATQQSVLRLLSTSAMHRIYGSAAVNNIAAWKLYQTYQQLAEVVWVHEPSEIEVLWSELSKLNTASPKVWMDAYLAAFAITSGLRFLTFDRDFLRFENAGLDLRLLGS